MYSVLNCFLVLPACSNSLARKFLASDGQEYKWAFVGKEDTEWTVRNFRRVVWIYSSVANGTITLLYSAQTPVATPSRHTTSSPRTNRNTRTRPGASSTSRNPTRTSLAVSALVYFPRSTQLNDFAPPTRAPRVAHYHAAYRETQPLINNDRLLDAVPRSPPFIQHLSSASARPVPCLR